MKCLRLAGLFFIFSFAFVSHAQTQSEDDWAAVPKTLGKAGKLQDGIYKVSFPRTDLDVHIGQTKVEAAAGLGSWIAFRKSTGGVLSDGDLVLLPTEVNPVLSTLQAGGFEITAIHNHLIGEEPQVMYVHFFGRADLPSQLTTLKTALSQTKTPVGESMSRPTRSFPDQKTIETVLGKPGTATGSVLAFSFARSHPITMHKEALPPPMGMATAINFQPSPKGVAATGDFVLKEDEVASVVSSLRKSDVMVTAMHNHLLDEEPRTVFVHFWAEGSAESVAKALKSALDAAPTGK